MAKLILIRHGQSEANIERRLDTRPPGAPLTELGREQARSFANSLDPNKVAVVVSSVARRAQETAAEIAGVLGRNAELREGIFEVQAGDLEDKSDLSSHKIFESTYVQWQLGYLQKSLPGGENGFYVLERFLPVLADLRKTYLTDTAAQKDVLVVSHGAAIRLVGAVLGGVDGGFASNHHLSNTETIELVPRADDSWECIRWGQEFAPFPVEDWSIPDSGPPDPSRGPMG
ncbi:MAG: histidine phosphatase family protein [Mycobacteriaceae bacterium]